MCSVVGCYSGRQSAGRFKLPEDPEERLEWVMFLAKTNKQRFKESSWTDITVCSDHFTGDCFVDETDPVRLKPGSVPSVGLVCGPGEPPVRSSGCEKSVVDTEVICLSDQAKTQNGATSYSEESRLILQGFHNGPVSEGASCSFASSVCFRSKPKKVDDDLFRKKVALLKSKGKFPVNEKHLVRLFNRVCPSCGGKLKMHKASRGVVIVLHQLCLQCDYTHEWKSLVDGSVPAAEGGCRTGGSKADETLSDVSEASETASLKEEGIDPELELEESSDPGDMDSDEDWRPDPGAFTVKLFPAKRNEDSSEGSDYCDYLPVAPRCSQLCADCGMFFDRRKPHACKHKVKPYSCNICGKRYASKVALNHHGRIHNENCEFPCKFCHVAFKVQADKLNHEQIHVAEGKPYKCSDCLEAFATNKERKIHLEDHRGPKQIKCHFCGIEFGSPAALQRHSAVHTRDKPFTCMFCRRAFSQASHLKTHVRLHTGERPYKCQHCEKCFNHNVSLKNHVQRHHTPSTRPEHRKTSVQEGDSGDARANGNETGEDSEFDSREEEQDTEDDVQMQEMYLPKTKKKSTGKSKGRPKNLGPRNIEDEAEGCGSDRSSKAHVKKQITQFANEDIKETPSDSNTSFDSAEEEKTRNKKVIKNTKRPKKRSKLLDSDSDFNSANTKVCSRQKNSNRSGKQRGRLRKKLLT